MRQKQSLAQSFASAFRGLGHALGERNFKIQVAIGATAIIFSFVLATLPFEKFIIIVLVALVLAAEMFNSALERIFDASVPEEHPEVAQAKELLAGAVLIFAIAAVVIGTAIFAGVLLR